jgi:predicted dehydrogenase
MHGYVYEWVCVCVDRYAYVHICISYVLLSHAVLLLGKVVAVSARTLEAATAFAEKHGIPKPYSSYEEMCQDPGASACMN